MKPISQKELASALPTFARIASLDPQPYETFDRFVGAMLRFSIATGGSRDVKAARAFIAMASAAFVAAGCSEPSTWPRDSKEAKVVDSIVSGEDLELATATLGAVVAEIEMDRLQHAANAKEAATKVAALAESQREAAERKAAAEREAAERKAAKEAATTAATKAAKRYATEKADTAKAAAKRGKPYRRSK